MASTDRESLPNPPPDVHEKQQPPESTNIPVPPQAPDDAEPESIVTTDHGADEKHLGPQAIPQLRLVGIIAGVALGLFLSMIDTSIVATSLFTIAVEFHDVDSINWVALAYTLTYLGCAVLFARVSDVVGRRAAFVAAYVVFVAFSLACGFATGMEQLIAFRALQGLGGSGLYSISMIILPEVTPDRAKKFIAAVVGLVVASAGVLGPVLGGILTQYTSWRWVFWINGPIGVASLVIFLLAWPNKKYLPSLERRAWKDVDFVGAFLLMASAVLIVFPFQNSSKPSSWSSATFLAPLLTGAPVWEHASAQGIMAQVRIFGGSIGIAASSAILSAKTAELVGGSIPPEALANLESDPSAMSPDQWALIRRVYTDALKQDMIVCCAVVAVAMVCTLGIYQRNRVSMEDMMKQRYREESERRKAAALGGQAVGTGALTENRTMSTATAMAQRLQGKTVLITGASSGIGRSVALEFARTAPTDLRLVLTARRADRLREVAAQIRDEVGDGVRVLPVELDVSDPVQVRGLVAALPEEFRGVDVLVNNAGLVKGVARAPEIAEEDVSVMFQTNVTGLINMTQAILPIFKARPDGGAGDIINIGSIAGREPYAGGSIYCASKAAVRAFTDALRKELIDTRIRVMEVDPGQVETEFSVVRFYGDKSKADAVYAGCEPLTPEDIAEVVVFVAGRRQNVVVADTLIFPSHQAGAGTMHRKPT
ncbi:hypothetical protein C8A00DRAFT_44201 [Chaetomidium leptoderma]|uniref:Major facilitator superfamily (MFS) profile domain-containing protein n=1 Tax=Chaetomidium leptoderma TaxID=669021 RepID=A0AAN6VK73_9PEZI|nr:hypothetical protein C8A00DRAFT_44201 [Chaetomidium leptoderma]